MYYELSINGKAVGSDKYFDNSNKTPNLVKIRGIIFSIPVAVGFLGVNQLTATDVIADSVIEYIEN